MRQPPQKLHKNPLWNVERVLLVQKKNQIVFVKPRLEIIQNEVEFDENRATFFQYSTKNFISDFRVCYMEMPLDRVHSFWVWLQSRFSNANRPQLAYNIEGEKLSALLQPKVSRDMKCFYGEFISFGSLKSI